MSAEKENSGVAGLIAEKCSVILLDVAGTITSINFVKDTLFPYVGSHVEEYLKSHWDEEAVKDAVKKLQTGDDALDNTTAAKLVKELTEKNSNNEGLKIIQGLIYKQGYEKKDLKAQIFKDVPPALDLWSKSKRIAVFSTGSVDSQKLFFSHTTDGDLTNHISNYFDQSVGIKTESSSYENICSKLDVKPEEVIFLTDDFDEAKAAKTSGVVPVLVTREGNSDIPEEVRKEYIVTSSFADLPLENVSKRKISEELDSSEVPPTKVPKTDETESDVKNAPTSKEENADVSDKPQISVVEPMEVDNVDTAEEKNSVSEENDRVNATEIDSTTESLNENEKIANDQTDSKKTEDVMAVEKKTDIAVEHENKLSLEGSKLQESDKETAAVTKQTVDSTDDIKETNKAEVSDDKTHTSNDEESVKLDKQNDDSLKSEPEQKVEETVIDKESAMNKKESTVSTNTDAANEEVSMDINDQTKTEVDKKVQKLETKDVKESNSLSDAVIPVSEERKEKVKDNSVVEKNPETAEEEKIEVVDNNQIIENELPVEESKVENSEVVNMNVESDKKNSGEECTSNKESSDKVDDSKVETVNDKILDTKEKNEEKENKSDMANGAEGDKMNGESIKNGEPEHSLKEGQSDMDDEEKEVKVKQIETNTETTTVSVAV